MQTPSRSSHNYHIWEILIQFLLMFMTIQSHAYIANQVLLLTVINGSFYAFLDKVPHLVGQLGL